MGNVRKRDRREVQSQNLWTGCDSRCVFMCACGSISLSSLCDLVYNLARHICSTQTLALSQYLTECVCVCVQRRGSKFLGVSHAENSLEPKGHRNSH